MKTRRLPDFRSPSAAPEGRVVRTRFGLRKTANKTQIKDQSIFSYGQPGRGVQGESSN